MNRALRFLCLTVLQVATYRPISAANLSDLPKAVNA